MPMDDRSWLSGFALALVLVIKHEMYNLGTMQDNLETPSFDERFRELDIFIHKLVELYEAGKISEWDDLERQVKDFFDRSRMDQMESLAPGWCKMASYMEGITLVHVMCVFLGMYMLPEFLQLSKQQQQIMKWVILFHDIDKFHIRGKKDTMHAFNSGVATANRLPALGFASTEKYPEMIRTWSQYTTESFLPGEGDAAPTPDNRKLSEILQGIEKLFGEDTAGALIVKTVLLHISLNVDDQYPTPAPLTMEEAQRYIDATLFPLLRVMMLSDNEGWSLFDPETRVRQRRDTLAAFEKIEKLIS